MLEIAEIFRSRALTNVLKMLNCSLEQRDKRPVPTCELALSSRMILLDHVYIHRDEVYHDQDKGIAKCKF